MTLLQRLRPTLFCKTVVDMEAETLVNTMHYSLRKVEAETLVDTLSDMDPKASAKTLAKTVSDTLGHVWPSQWSRNLLTRYQR